MCQVALGVKTVNNWYLGNPNKLADISKELDIDRVFEEAREGISYKDIGTLRIILYTIFEYIPKKLLGQETYDLYSLYSGKCLPVLSDMPIVLSFLNVDFPSYTFILGKRRNVFFTKDSTCSSMDLSTYPVLSDKPVQIYAYNSYGFAFSNRKLSKGYNLVVKVPDKKKVLVLVYKDGALYNVFSQNNIKETLTVPGRYGLYVYNYAFRVWKLFFGLRFLSCAEGFTVME